MGVIWVKKGKGSTGYRANKGIPILHQFVGFKREENPKNFSGLKNFSLGKIRFKRGKKI